MIKTRQWSFLIFLLLTGTAGFSQTAAPIDSIQFFVDEKPMEIKLGIDMKILMGEKPQGQDYLPATFSTRLPPDSTLVTEQIRITTRGHVRRAMCYMPPLKLNFHNTTSPRLYPLHTLKLVVGCKTNPDFEQLILKEYLIYKMYNLISDLSFRVRLAHVNYEDLKGKRKGFAQYAFFLESESALAKRNHCKEWKGDHVMQEGTLRKQMTVVSLFEFMIANTDWGVPAAHNIKLIYNHKDSIKVPIAVPYDFDYSGLVNADYAVAEPQLGIDFVTQRLYRGFPRIMSELTEAIANFNKQKEPIYSLIRNFEPLSVRNKKDMIGYLDDFFKIINDKRQIQDMFIDHARKD